MSKRWFVQFYVWNEAKQSYVQKKVAGYINTFHTAGERLAAAQELKSEIQKLLEEGWTVGKKNASEMKKLFQGFTTERALDFLSRRRRTKPGKADLKFIGLSINSFLPG